MSKATILKNSYSGLQTLSKKTMRWVDNLVAKVFKVKRGVVAAIRSKVVGSAVFFYTAWEIGSVISIFSETYVDGKEQVRDNAGFGDEPETLEYIASYLETLSYVDYVMLCLALKELKDTSSGVVMRTEVVGKTATTFLSKYGKFQVVRANMSDLGRRTLMTVGSFKLNKFKSILTSGAISSPVKTPAAKVALATVATLAAIVALFSEDEKNQFAHLNHLSKNDRENLAGDSEVVRNLGEVVMNSSDEDSEVDAMSIFDEITSLFGFSQSVVSPGVQRLKHGLDQTGLASVVKNELLTLEDVMNYNDDLVSYKALCSWSTLDDTGLVFHFKKKRYTCTAMHSHLTDIYISFQLSQSTRFSKLFSGSTRSNGMTTEKLIGPQLNSHYHALFDMISSPNEIEKDSARGYHRRVQHHLDMINSLEYIMKNDAVLTNSTFSGELLGEDHVLDLITEVAASDERKASTSQFVAADVHNPFTRRH